VVTITILTISSFLLLAAFYVLLSDATIRKAGSKQLAIAACLIVLVVSGQFFGIDFHVPFALGISLAHLVILSASALFLSAILRLRQQSHKAQQQQDKQDKYLEQFTAFFEHGGVGMYSYDTTGAMLRANPAFCQMIGYSSSELKNMSIFDFSIPEERPGTEQRLKLFREKINDPCNFEKTYLRKDGSTLIGHFTGKWIQSKDGSIYAVALVEDITEHKKADMAVLKERSFLQTVIDSVKDPIIAISKDYRVILANQAAQENLSDGQHNAEGLLCHQLCHELDEPCSGENYECPLKEVLRTGKEVKVIHEHRRADGLKRIYEIKASPLYDEDNILDGIVESSRDLTDILNSEAELDEKKKHLHYVTTHDLLTNLPNRELFFDRLERATLKTSRSGCFTALLLIDLDRFKNINDSLGHKVGDQLLQQVADRLRKSVRKTDTLARIGGDEFLIIVEDLAQLTHVDIIARNFIGLLLPPFKIDGNELFITPSMGISVTPSDTDSPKEMLSFAEVAMYQAKELGGNKYQFYTAAMNTRTKNRIQLEGHLRKAISQNQFALYYQPQFDLQSGALIGCEALIRWQHPEMGLIPPNDFIPLAEETGVIIEIGEWVLKTACLKNKQWHNDGHERFRTAVNISVRQFREPGFLEMVERVLDETGLEPQWLELEITESLLMEDIDGAIAILSRLKDKGIHIAIDDFGTGYSSLSYLKRFPLSHLKIDRSFVRDIVTDENDASITMAVIALAHSMNLKVIAEGIETKEQLDFLTRKGCEFGQGYLYSPPLPEEQFLTLLQQQR
jgi:diguanylate cyclase (GGDEF)-like protein/PAS domain S-box-containing protein